MEGGLCYVVVGRSRFVAAAVGVGKVWPMEMYRRCS